MKLPRPFAARLAVISTMSVFAAAAKASPAEIEQLKQELRALTEKLQQLEQVQGHASQQTTAVSADEAYADELLAFFGLVETELSYSDHDIEGSSSDAVVATVELAVDAQLTDRMTATVAYAFNGDIDTGKDTLENFGASVWNTGTTGITTAPTPTACRCR